MSIGRFLRVVCVSHALVAAAVAQPANNTCGQNQPAFTIPGAGGSVNGTLLSATADPGSTSCVTTTTDVYYYFTPAVSGPHEFSTCSSTFNINTVLSIHTGCPATSSNLVGTSSNSCNDNDPNCGNRSRFDSPSLPAGIPVIVRVARGAGSGGAASDFTLTVTPHAPGACCNALLGECALQTELGCSGTFQGIGSTCSPNPCPPTGACCNSGTGECLVRTQAGCATGNWLGAGGSCTPNPCAQLGACCDNTTLACTFTANCGSGQTFKGVGVSCAPSPCVGACCPGKSTTCYLTSMGECLAHGGDYDGDGSTCANFNCQLLGACCLNGGCAMFTIDYCFAAGGSFNSVITTCAPSPCPTGACCADGCCRTTIQSLCTGVWHDGATCSAGGPCPLTASTDACAPGLLTLGAAICGDNSASTHVGYVTPCGADASVALSHIVFYRLVAPYAANYSFSTCDVLYQFDTVLIVYDGDCNGGTRLGCNDDACGNSGLQSQVSGVSLAAGQQVLVLVAAFGPNSLGGAFRLQATADVAMGGACCTGGACALTLPGTCTTPSIYQGDNSSCTPTPCIGACCLGAGPPITTDRASCTGAWTSCTVNCACTTPPPNDGCAGAITLTPGVTLHGANHAATPDISGCQPTPLPYSVWYTFIPPINEFYVFDLCGSDVQPSIMMLTGACPGSNYDCGGSASHPGAPCLDRASLIVGAPLAAGVRYSLVVWSPGAIGAPTGPGNLAITVNAAPMGACCCGATCSLTAAGACIGADRRFVGSGAACNAPDTNTAPCCRADFNQNHVVSVQDIFDYLAGYFSGSACTDINSSSIISVQDIFDYLAAYFAGCA